MLTISYNLPSTSWYVFSCVPVFPQRLECSNDSRVYKIIDNFDLLKTLSPTGERFVGSTGRIEVAY